MNKSAIEQFAIWARKRLIDDITYKAGLIGITREGIVSPLPQSTSDLQLFDIGTKSHVELSGAAIYQRKRLVDEIRNKDKASDYQTAFDTVIEEVAYTWFNRLIAIRFMEVNGYLPSRVRVLSSDQPGKQEPDIVTTPFETDLDFTGTEHALVVQLKNDNELDALFRLLFLKQCNALHEILPGLFERTADYSELLLPLSFTDRDGVVYHLVNDIPEADFDVSQGGQIEIIGWLYQFYNSQPKDQVYADLKQNKKITKEKIPAATQLFTPEWIVKYMVENSLGRLWVEGHPNESLKKNWQYYLEQADQEPEVEEKLEAIQTEYSALNPKISSLWIPVWDRDIF